MSTDRRPRAPAGLGAAGRRLWREHVSDLTFRPDETAVLRRAAAVADRIERIEADLGDATTSTGSTGQTVAHPLLVELRHAERHLADLLHRLQVPDAPGSSGKSWAGLTASERGSRAASIRWNGS